MFNLWQLSLFFDFMLPMCTLVDQDAFVSGNRSGFYGKAPYGDGEVDQIRKRAKLLLWKELRMTKAKAGTCICSIFC